MTNDDDTQPQEPTLLNGNDVYDMLMSKIEPELTLARIRTLRQQCKEETPDQRKARALRYEKAFREYDRQYAEYQKAWNKTFAVYKREALQSLEQSEREDDADAMKRVEEAMNE